MTAAAGDPARGLIRPSAAPPRRHDAAALLALALLTAVLFGRAVAGRGVFFQRDVQTYWRPQVDSLMRILAQGAPPVWNPYFEVGLPLLADPGYQVYYPPQWVNLLVLPDRFYALFVAGHGLFTAVGAYALGRRWGLRWWAAFAFGAAWLSSGPYLSLVSNNAHMPGSAWIPWVLLALERALHLRTARAAALVGAAAALQLLAGSGDMALMTAGLAAARLALWLLRAPGPRRDRAAVAARIALAGGTCALALSAPLWLPTLAIVRSGGRAHMDPSLNAYWSVHPATLVDLFVPGAVSTLPLTPATREELFEGREPFLPSLYVGMAAVPFALLGLRASRARGLLLMALALALVATAVGRYGWLYGWVLEVPGASLFRYPIKYLLPATLAWAALAAFGLAVFGEVWTPRACRTARISGALALLGAAALAGFAWALLRSPDVLAGIAVDLPTAAAGLSARVAHSGTAVALAGVLLIARSFLPRPRPALTAAAVLLVAGDLLLTGRGVNPTAPPELMAHEPALLRFIPPRPDGFPTRVFAKVDDARSLNRRVVRGPAGWDREWSWALGLQDLLSPPTGARWGLGGAYDGDFTGLGPATLSAYSAVVRDPRAGRLALNLLRVGGIDYVVSLEPSPYGLREVASAESVYESPVRLFPVPEPAPRAYLARASMVPHPALVWERMSDPSFEPGKEIVMVGDAREATPAPPLEGRVAVASRRADRVELDVALAASGHAVLTEMHAPGWTAAVDGAAVPVETANLLFCAAAVPAGRHRVVFEYHAPGARAGLVAAAGGLATLAALFVPRTSRRLPTRQPSATIAAS